MKKRSLLLAAMVATVAVALLATRNRCWSAFRGAGEAGGRRQDGAAAL